MIPRATILVSTGCLIAALVTSGMPAEARSPTRAKCFPAKSTSLVRSKQTRVYRDRRGETAACNYETGHSEALSDKDEGIYVYPPPAIDLAGVLVGFAVEDRSDPVGLHFTAIRVISARTGRPKNPFTTVDPPNTDGKVGSLRINRQASVAWIVCEYSQNTAGNPRPECVRPGHEARVWKLERGGGPNAPTLLDQGTDIDPRSLGLRGSELSWIRGGERQTAELD